MTGWTQHGGRGRSDGQRSCSSILVGAVSDPVWLPFGLLQTSHFTAMPPFWCGSRVSLPYACVCCTSRDTRRGLLLTAVLLGTSHARTAPSDDVFTSTGRDIFCPALRPYLLRSSACCDGWLTSVSQNTEDGQLYTQPFCSQPNGGDKGHGRGQVTIKKRKRQKKREALSSSVRPLQKRA